MFFKKMQDGIPILVPVDDDTKNILRTLKPDVLLRGDIVAPRNPLNHRRLFALLQTTVMVSERYNTPDKALDMIKFAVGHVRDVFDPIEQRVKTIPDSISYANMDETAFGAFFSLAIDAVLKHVEELAGHSATQVEAMVERAMEFSW